MDPIEVQAKFDMLIAQRDNAMNTVVNQHGEIAMLKANMNALNEQLELATMTKAKATKVTHRAPIHPEPIPDPAPQPAPTE